MKAIRLFLGVFLVLALVQPVRAVGVGQHLHVEIANHPVDGFPIAKAPYTFHVTLREHNFNGNLRYLRLDDNSLTSDSRRLAVSGGPCADCVQTFDWTVDFSSWSTGRHEFRWHLDAQDADLATANTQRQYTTARAQVCIVSCAPSYRSQANFNGGGSWYTGPGYVVALITSPDSAIKPGGRVSIRSQYSNATACAFLNPRFHDGDHGTALGCGTSVTIPATAVPGDKLVIVALGAQEAGVMVETVGDGTPRATVARQFQSWWNKGGLSIP